MRLSHAVSAAALIAIAAAAACSGGQSTNYVAPPSAGGAISAGGPVVLSQTATVESAGSANGITGALTFGAGTGTVTSVASATAPFGTTTVVPASKSRIVLAAATTSPTSPNVYYVTITSPTGATLAGLPGVSLSLSTPAVGTYQEAEWNGTAYANVTGATASTNVAGTAVSFPAGTTAVTIPANGSIYLAFYQGTYPNATPVPLATPTNVIADSDFSSPATAAPIGSAVTSNGWTVCTITAAAPGAAAPPYPFSTYSTTGTVPGAAIEAAGTAVPQGTKTPAPVMSVPNSPPSGYAAVFGGVFSTYTLANYAYNGLCQTVKIPNNATGALQVFASGTENSLSYFNFDVDVLDTSGRFLGALITPENQIATTPPGDSAYRTITIPATMIQPYAGQTVQLFVGIWTKAGSSTGSTVYSGYYFVDLFTLSGVPL